MTYSQKNPAWGRMIQQRHDAAIEDEARARNPRLFIGVYPCGLVYADRHREEHGDYKRLAFLPFATMAVEYRDDCLAELRLEIAAHARELGWKKGDTFQVTTSGQTIILGRDA